MTTISLNSQNITAEISTREAAGNRPFRRLFVGGAMAVTLLALSGCSAVPDALNPAQWYNNTVGFFSGEDAQGQVARQENPGEGQPFPTLAPVPKRSAQKTNKGLVADVEGRRYAQSIARQGQFAETAVADTAPSVQPAPPAIPTLSVTPVPVPEAIPKKMAAVPEKTPLVAPTEVAAVSPEPTLNSGELPANAMLPLDGDPYETVVISSNGVEIGGATTALPDEAALPLQPTGSNLPQGAEPVVQRYPQGADGVKIATILFANGSDNLSSLDRKILGQVVLLHKARGGQVRVVGYSSSRTRSMDAVRHAMVNYKLSADRANTIAAALVRQGMPADVMVVDSLSDTMPLYSESMPSGEAGNRRAEVYFVN